MQSAKPIVDAQRMTAITFEEWKEEQTSLLSTEEGDCTCIWGKTEKASSSQPLHLFTHPTYSRISLQQFSLLLHQIFLLYWIIPVIISPILKNNQQNRVLTLTSWRAVLLSTVFKSSFPILQSNFHSHHFHWNYSSVSSLHVLKTLSHDSVFSLLELLIAFDVVDHSFPLEITVFTWLRGHLNLWVFLLLHWSFLLSLSC